MRRVLYGGNLYTLRAALAVRLGSPVWWENRRHCSSEVELRGSNLIEALFGNRHVHLIVSSNKMKLNVPSAFLSIRKVAQRTGTSTQASSSHHSCLESIHLRPRIRNQATLVALLHQERGPSYSVSKSFSPLYSPRRRHTLLHLIGANLASPTTQTRGRVSPSERSLKIRHSLSHGGKNPRGPASYRTALPTGGLQHWTRFSCACREDCR